MNIGYDEPKVVRQLAAAMRSFAVSTAATYLYTGTEMDGVQCIYTVVDSPLLFLLTVGMGVNATGTLGVAGRAPKTRESRRRGGLGGAVPLPRKFMNFSSQNGVICYILGVLFSRFMCPMDCSCMINFIEVPVCA